MWQRRASETLRAQTVNNHNLANVSTTGFADLAAFQAARSTAPASRHVYATNGTVGWDKSSGALPSTGRDLDVAINGPGWIAAGSGRQEAYTRAGNLQVDATGQLSPPPASR
jgi:flagellar basal-body rod protein FlgF